MGSKTLGKGLVAEGEHLAGQKGGVLCAIDTDGGHGDARRHLDDAEQGVETVQHALDGYTDDRQGGLCSNDTRQSGSHTGSSDDDTDATTSGLVGKLLHSLRCAVCRQGVHLEGYLQLVELLTGFLHDGQVAGAAHDNANDRVHIFSYSFWFSFSSSL